MTDLFNPPETCRICSGTMQTGTLKTTREGYMIPDRYPFERLTSGELWYALEQMPDGKFVMLNKDGPLMVLHYRCEDCGYLESYARGRYPQ
ncbi:MAG: hypothetical protein HS100_02160 [Anaerolineales bacterium]|nr:hypothetical protein [Anaerolineales bacterium]MCE7858732.1 hypothetical protein [Chloroflexi bacterium CFX2]